MVSPASRTYQHPNHRSNHDKTNSWVPTPRMPRWVNAMKYVVSNDRGFNRILMCNVAMSSQIPDPDSHQLQNVTGDSLFFWGLEVIDNQKCNPLEIFETKLPIIIIVQLGALSCFIANEKSRLTNTPTPPSPKGTCMFMAARSKTRRH